MKTASLRELIRTGEFLHMPAVYDPLGGLLVQSSGFKVCFVGGYVTGAALAISEPLLTMTEQVGLAGAVANALDVPLIADAGAGWGDALHTMRTVREFSKAGVAGVHIEDQIFPKRAHYHKYVAHVIPIGEYVEKIHYACRERDRIDRNFLIIARTDSCRFFGLEEAVKRVNAAAKVGADMGLMFPRNPDEAARAPRLAEVPLIYVQSLGNRDGRPTFGRQELQTMGYAGCIEAQFAMLYAFTAMREALHALAADGRYDGMDQAEYVAARQAIEDIIGLEEYYGIEQNTVDRAGRPDSGKERKALALPAYELYAIRYARRDAQRRDHFIGGDPHDAPMPMDYFVWVAKGKERAVVIDIGFTAEVAAKRRRTFLRCPIEAMRLIDVEAAAVKDVVLTHLHYDHCGNLGRFPVARFHLQESELHYATGRYMAYPKLSHSFEVEDVCDVVRLNYRQRVTFYNGDAELAPGIELYAAGGHSAGLQFARVNTARGWVVVASDVSHFYENMESGRPFTTALRVGQMLEGFDRLLALAPTRAHIVPGHDPEVMRRYPTPSPKLDGIVVRLDVAPHQGSQP